MSERRAPAALEARARLSTTRARAAYLALLVGSLVLLGFLLVSPDFRIDQPRVEGASLVEPAAIVEISGLTGRSVFLVDPPEAERAVEDLRPIQSAKVRITWPNEATISVVERQPVAIWRSGTSSFLVSADGIILGRAHEQRPSIVIRDADERGVFVGGQVEPGILAEASQIREMVSASGQSSIVDGTVVSSGVEGLAVTVRLAGSTSSTTRVLFGRGSNVRQKLEIWKQIEPEITAGKLKAELVDLRIADRPFLR